MDSYIGNRPLNQAAGFRHEVYATAGQTVFPVAYAVGYLDVFQNGVKLGVDDFTATDGATVTLAQGAAADDLIAFIAWAKGTMAPVEEFYTKTLADARFVNVDGDTMTGPLTISPAATNTGLDILAPPTGDGRLVVRGANEGGEIQVANADRSKVGAIDLIQASNSMRVFHAMGGTMRIWEFRSNGCLSTQPAGSSDEAVPLGQGDGRYARLAVANIFQQPATYTGSGANGNAVNFQALNGNVGAIYGHHTAGVWLGLGFAAGAQYFSMRSDGNGVAPVAWIPASDGRVKVDRIEIGDALTKVATLTGYTYRRTDLGSDARHGGLIAQDVEAVLAEAVSVIGKGNEHQPEDMKALDYNAVIALLVNAVKELKARVEALEA